MYKSIKQDTAGNLWYEYELGGLPFRWAQVQPIPQEEVIESYRRFHAWNVNGISEYNELVKRWSEKQGRRLEDYLPLNDIIRMVCVGQIPREYSLHHLIPRALGGAQEDENNVVLIEKIAHKKLHYYMNDIKLIRYLTALQQTGNLKKAYLSIPILPPVVHEKDIPFVAHCANKFRLQQRNGRER